MSLSMADAKRSTKGCLGWLGFFAACYLGWVVYDHYIGKILRVPDEVSVNQKRLTEISKLYYDYNNKKGRFPNNMADLMAAYSDYLIDQDVWGFKFRMTTRDNKVWVYSVGPDLTDNNGEIEYNPSNGVRSAGDQIYFLRDLNAPPPERPE